MAALQRRFPDSEAGQCIRSEILAAATSAVREAENGGEFRQVERETGIRANVISGTEEAR
jgi:exopolyphosphatase/pppGpp-phosphohydrolase